MMLLDYIRSLPVYSELVNVHSTGEGNLLEITDTDTAEAQISFFIWALGRSETFDVLEIGTNKGLWGLLLSVIRPNVGLTTIDINPDSAKAADILADSTDLDCVYFLCGNSMDILPGLHTRFDFAWVDGHHGYEYALSDLTHCARLGIPYIAIDDTNTGSVLDAVNNFLETTQYVEVPNPFIDRDTRKALLLKRIT